MHSNWICDVNAQANDAERETFAVQVELLTMGRDGASQCFVSLQLNSMAINLSSSVHEHTSEYCKTRRELKLMKWD